MNKQKSIISQLKAARRCSVPLIAITTPDPAATIASAEHWAQAGLKPSDPPAPQLQWDVVEGPRPRNEQGKDAIGKMLGDTDPLMMQNPVMMLQAARKLPESAILFFHLANRWLEPPVIQAIWNLRDEFKRNRRTLILLCPAIDLPAELAGDVVVLDEPLPDVVALSEMITEQHEATGQKIVDEQLAKAAEAVQGLAAFQAEQVVAMSLTRDGLKLDDLWERKRRQIELTPGLKVHREQVKFADIGGVGVVKGFLQRLTHGESRPNAVVFVDEIEKFLAGAMGSAGDSSGVSQDQLGTLLSYMQDHGSAGMIFVGPPGSAKSMVAKAAGIEAGVPTIQLDLGGMKGSLVGQSEQNLRAALKVITSVSNGKAIWIATCNAIAELPPELRRRFTLGTFFFDLPDKDERKTIWKIYLAKYGFKGATAELPDDDGWTGAECRACCDIAYRLSCSLKEAAAFIVPVSRSAAEQIAKLRKAAEGRFLSASRPGTYRQPSETDTASKSRKLSLED